MIQVEGLSLERFLNMAAEQGINVFDARRISYTVLRAGVSARGYSKLNKLDSRRYTISAGKGFGMPFWLKRLFKRKALLAGLALIALGLTAASQFIWEITVDGVSHYEGTKIKSELEEMGLKPGVWKGNLDLKHMTTAVLIAHDEIAWMDINYSGVVVVVKIVPADLPPDVYDEKKSCNIIARKDSLIESVIQLAGRAAVKKGDTVRAGDVLISGVVWDPGLPRMEFAAKGKVIGNVWYKGEASAPIYEQTRVKTGRTQAEREIVIGADSATIDGSCTFVDYDTEVKGEFALGGGLFLPVKVRELLHSEINVTQTPVAYAILRAYLEEEAYSEALSKAPQDANIIGHKTFYSLENNVMKAAVYLHTQEDIGRVVYLEE
jgi:similar to stage IV sporulation protein